MASARYTLNIEPEDTRPDQPVQRTRGQKMANWWHYHWKMLAVIAVLLALLGMFIRDMLSVERPDYQLALVSTEVLPQGLQDALNEAMTSRMRELNQDDSILVEVMNYQLNFSVLDTQTQDQDVGEVTDAYLIMAQSTLLTADLASKDSTIFLLDDPEGFQETYGILSAADGTLPSEEDPLDGVEWFAWSDCPELTALDLGEYTNAQGETVSGQEYMQDFVVARRGYTDKQPEDIAEQQALFQAITAGATAR